MSPQAILTGRSTPKVVRVNADDGKACLYKNLGNGRRVPFLWADTVTLASGTSETTVASGVEFNDFKVCDGKITYNRTFTLNNINSTASGTYAAMAGTTYIEKDVDNNVVILKTSSAVGYDTDWDVYVYLGSDTTYTSASTNQIWARRDSNSM